MSRSILRSVPWPRFELGDRVILQSGLTGTVVGIRYGEPAYDVRVQGTCIRNIHPEHLRPALQSALAAAA
jgi:hypothetical protein